MSRPDRSCYRSWCASLQHLPQAAPPCLVASLKDAPIVSPRHTCPVDDDLTPVDDDLVPRARLEILILEPRLGIKDVVGVSRRRLIRHAPNLGQGGCRECREQQRGPGREQERAAFRFFLQSGDSDISLSARSVRTLPLRPGTSQVAMEAMKAMFDTRLVSQHSRK